MSKSYGNYKTVGFCCGSNTDFYRMRRKHQRRVNNHRMRNIMSNYDSGEFDDMFTEFIIPKTDQWNEPTDGHRKLDAKYIKKSLEWDKKKSKWWNVYVTKDNKVKK